MAVTTVAQATAGRVLFSYAPQQMDEAIRYHLAHARDLGNLAQEDAVTASWQTLPHRWAGQKVDRPLLIHYALNVDEFATQALERHWKTAQRKPDAAFIMLFRRWIAAR